MINFKVDQKNREVSFGNLVAKKDKFLDIKHKMKNFYNTKKSEYLMVFAKEVLGSDKSNEVYLKSKSMVESFLLKPEGKELLQANIQKQIKKDKDLEIELEEQKKQNVFYVGIKFSQSKEEKTRRSKEAAEAKTFAYLLKIEMLKGYAMEMGCSVKTAFDTFHKLEWKTKILPYRDISSKFLTGKGGLICQSKYSAFIEMKDSVLDAVEDRNENIIPLIIGLKRSPSELRKWFGKGLWKRLTKNSVSRNKLLVPYLTNQFIGSFSNTIDYTCLPSTLLKNKLEITCDKELEAFNLLKESLPLYKITNSFVSKTRHTIYDTKMMANRLDYKMPDTKKFKLQDWENLHTEMKDAINKQAYSKDKLSKISNVAVKFMESDNYTINVLDNAYDIYLEGQEMHHCVGGYSYSVREGTYLVYSIKGKSGERYSTLGLYRDSNNNYTFSQHYKKFNKSVDDPEAVKLANKVLETLNARVIKIDFQVA